MEKEFYVYLYLDPRKKGKYNYDYYEFNYEPFYVGKGKGVRCYEHLTNGRLNKQSYKNNKIKKIINEGFIPIVIKIEDSLLEDDAFILEVNLIKLIGRSDLGLGSLTNKTNGGDGVSGLIRSKSHRKKISENNRKRVVSDETRKKISDSLKDKRGRNTGNKHSKETKEKISNSKKGIVTHNAIPIIQLTKNGDLIKEWRSAKYASEKLKISQGNIWSVLNGNRKTCSGFKWVYKK